jgi:hypothetical protein
LATHESLPSSMAIRALKITPCSFVVGLRSSDTGTVDRVGRSGGSRPTVVLMLEAGLGRGLVWNGPHSWSSQCRSYFVVLYMLANTPAVLPRGEPAKGGTLCTQHPSLCGVARFFYFPKLPRSAHSLCTSRTPQFESCVLAPLPTCAASTWRGRCGFLGGQRPWRVCVLWQSLGNVARRAPSFGKL